MSVRLRTPPMGWNAWNYFGSEGVNETIVRETAQAMVDFGFLAAGYNFLNVDDCWMLRERGADGALLADPARFPHGMKALGDELHGMGFHFGLYAGAGVQTFGGGAGSFGHEWEDARQFASFGVDLLKYDCGHIPEGEPQEKLYRKMGQALRKSGRDIVYSVCTADEHVTEWARSTGGSIWRVASDLIDEWDSIVRMAKRAQSLSAFAGPNGWNDADMLVVGLNGEGHHGHHGPGCTYEEYQTHFALWCMLASPLILGHDVRHTTPEAAKILLNPELIALDQDELGLSAYVLPSEDGGDWVLAKPLANGDLALCAVNESDKEKEIVLSWEACGWDPAVPAYVRDVLRREDLGERQCGSAVRILPHGCIVWRLSRK